MLNNRFQSSLNWVIAANLVMGILNFAAGVWFARVLGPSVMGEYALITTAVFLITGMFSMGFDQAIIRFPNRGDVESAAILATHLQAVGLVLVSIVVYGAYLHRGPHAIGNMAGPAVGVFSSVIVGLYANLSAAPIAAQLEYRKLSRFRLLSVFLGVGLGLCFLRSGVGIYSLVARDLITALMLFALIARESPLKWVFAVNREGLKCLAKFNGALWGLNLMERLTLRLDYAMVGFLFGKEALGIYFAIRSVMEGAVGFLIQPMQTVLYAHHCRNRDAVRIRETLLGNIPLLYGIGVAVIAFLAYEFAPWLICFAFGVRYSSAIPLVPGFVLYAGAIVWFEFVKVSAMACDSHYSILLARVMQLLIYLPLMIVLGRYFGFLGAGLAMGGAAMVLALVATLRLWMSLRNVA